MINKKRILGITTIIIFALIGFWFLYSYFNHSFIYSLFQGDLSTIKNAIDQRGIMSLIIFGLLIILECIFAPFPPLILYVAGGVVFGGFLAGVVATAGNFLGAGIAFMIARIYGRDWVKGKVPGQIMKKVDKFSEKYGAISIFFLRLNPLTSSDLFSYAAGLTKMKRGQFLFWTILGLIPTIFLQTYLGGEISSHPLLTDIFLLGGAIYLIGFFIIYFWLKKRNATQKNK